MSKYKLTLNLPLELSEATQRVLEGHDTIVVDRQNGYVGELTSEQLKVAEADPYIKVNGKGADGEKPNEAEAPKQPTKDELLSQAKAEGLELKVTKRNTISEINAAIEEARKSDSDEETADESDEDKEDTDGKGADGEKPNEE